MIGSRNTLDIWSDKIVSLFYPYLRTLQKKRIDFPPFLETKYTLFSENCFNICQTRRWLYLSWYWLRCFDEVRVVTGRQSRSQNRSRAFPGSLTPGLIITTFRFKCRKAIIVTSSIDSTAYSCRFCTNDNKYFYVTCTSDKTEGSRKRCTINNHH